MSSPRCPRIVVVGSINTDLIMKVRSLPASGETVVGGVFTQAAGGKGANAAVAAARAGAKVAFVGSVGEDSAGLSAMENLQSDGIATRFIVRSGGAATGTAVILLDSEGRNSIAVASGANHELTRHHVEAAQEAIRGADWMLLVNEIASEAASAALTLARQLGVPTMFNYAPALPSDVPLSDAISLLVVNEHEAATLAKMPVSCVAQAHQAAAFLQSSGPERVVVTMGAEGVVGLDGKTGDSWHRSAFEVEARDTTAAGDTFCGALAVALGEGRSLHEATRFAQAAAALSVTRAGAQPSIPVRAEIDAFCSRTL